MTSPERSDDAAWRGGVLVGRLGLITGAYGTLGAEIARRLRRDGADLLLVGRSPERLAELAKRLAAEHGCHGRLDLLAVDLAAADAAERVAAAVARLGHLDVLVNNAAIQGPIGPLWENDWQAWQETIRIDLLAPVALCRALVGFLGRDKRGKIINISGGGASGPRANFSAYGVAKTGLVRFTETFAEEVRARNIDVNAVAPGALGSAMTDAILAAGPELCGEEEIAAARKAKAGEAQANVEKAAALCAWLASAKSDGISGRLLAALWDPWATLDLKATELAGSDIYTLRRILPKDRGKDWEPPD
ncbi:MAG: SDR family oxidoreductase [Alphaproteobacteria bacterium]